MTTTPEKARTSEKPVLRVRDLSIRFAWDDPDRPTVSDVSFELGPGQVLALVGQSGSGKSLTAAAILGLLPREAEVARGALEFTTDTGAVAELTGLTDRQLDVFRGSGIGMIFQNPLSSLDPSFTIGNQLGEIIGRHRPSMSRAERRDFGAQWLSRVGFDDPERALDSYPHELSGGMRQRAMIALASLSEPALLIADEPTTALDTVVQRQVLDVLRDTARSTGAALLFITHDFDVVEYLADNVVVLEKGTVVESGSRDEVFGAPRHPYTRELLASVPRLGRRASLADWRGPRRLGVGDAGDRGVPSAASASDPAVERNGIRIVAALDDVTKEFVVGSRSARRRFVALDHVSLQVHSGEIYGVIGASGSGKSTLARVMGGLLDPTGGSVRFEGTDLAGAGRRGRRELRPRLQYVFQDPASSLNPALHVGTQIARPLKRFGRVSSSRDARRAVADALDLVGLPAAFADRYPHSLSGGQQQRVGIARALALEPQLLILDEPTSSLDVSAQAGIVDLLLELRRELDLTCVFIGHNLALVEWMCDRIGVLDAGRLVDEFATEDLHSEGRHSAVQKLLEADLGSRKLVVP
ncbi:ATP-binding cassette domain-containing protein [Rhodococcus zopfii]|uniref:ATP-binding cassette domain-containing protein n=1 Tax=Rhodococcus zopfii TaxID=43772 RepID=UPI0011112FC9|nr:ABC transporter ATP-binding protein [Rhodococcus zopfii]